MSTEPFAGWINTPTLSSMRDHLKNLEDNGMSPGAFIEVTMVANMPGTFIVREVRDPNEEQETP